MVYCESKYNVKISESQNGVIIYNTVTGAVCNFQTQIYDKFHNKLINENQIDNRIVKLGFVVPLQFDELNCLEKCKKGYIYNQNPNELSYVIAPTLNCNYKCEYCFESKIEQNKCVMSHVTIDNIYRFIVNQIVKYKNIKRIFVLWFGGEPMLAYDAICSLSAKLQAYSYSHNIKYEAFMATNGSMLTGDIAHNLVDNFNLRGFQITMDGLHDSYTKNRKCDDRCYDKVMNNIFTISKFATVRLRINVSDTNIDEIKSLLSVIASEKKYGDYFSIYFARIKNYLNKVNVGITAMEYEKVRNDFIDFLISNGCENILSIKLPQKIATGCGSMRNYTCVIGPNGELYRCEHCLGDQNWIIGDVKYGFYCNEADKLFLERKMPIKCYKCDILPVCAGGCTADAVLHNIEFDCDAYRYRIISNVKRAINKKLSSNRQSFDSNIINDEC